MPAPVDDDGVAAVRSVFDMSAGAAVARMLLWVSLVGCARPWQWRETVPDWLWVVTAVAGWACFRATLRAAGRPGVRADGGRRTVLQPSAAWALVCGACAYAANVAHAPDLLQICSCLALAGLSGARRRLPLVAMVAVPVALTVLVLWRADAEDAASELLAMGTAWVCGLAVTTGVFALLGGDRASSAAGSNAAGLPAPVACAGAPAAVWHGRLLVATAACIPLGEGLALVMLGLVGGMTLLRRRHIPWQRLRADRAVCGMATGLAVWACAGAAALVVGGEGWLKPGELGRWVPYLAAVLPVLAVGTVPPRVFSDAARAFVTGLLVACGVGLCMYACDLRPGSGVLSFLRVPSDQAHVPYTLRQVAGGFYFHRLKMAHVLLVGIACLAPRQILVPMPGRRRLLEAAALLLLCVTLFFTFARGAWLGLAAVGAVCMAVGTWRLRVPLLAGGVLVALLAVGLPEQRARLRSTLDPQASAVRAAVWEQAVAVLHAHPFGVGLGNYTPLIGRYYDRIPGGAALPRTYPHSMVLAAWAETGPLGLAGYVGAWVVFLGACRRVVRRKIASPEAVAVAAAGIAAAAALWVVGLTHDVLFHNSVALAFCGTAGLVTALRLASSEALRREQSVSHPVRTPCP